MDYKGLYFALFNSLTDAIELMNKGDLSGAKEILIAAQQKAEDAYIEGEE